MANSGRPGVFCVEGDWETSMASRQSVEPVLRLLEDCGRISYVHRNVATRSALQAYIDRWLGRGMSAYRLGYFGFHGSTSTLHLSRDANEDISLDELAGMIDGRAKGRVIYFGSCRTLAVKDEALTEFCRKTRARGVVGYTRSVYFTESAGFEVLMLDDLLGATNFKSAYTRLRNQHPVLTKNLGLRMAHATWASDRKIALDART